MKSVTSVPPEWVDASLRHGVRKTFAPDRSLRLGLFWPYSRTPIPSALVASRNPDVMEPANHVRLARAAEQAGLDFVLLPDGYASGSDDASEIGFQDPSTHGVIWALPLLLATQRMGVLSTIHTTFVHPVQIARFGGHLDHLSGGRWGWNVVAGNRPVEARLFGFDDVPDHDMRYDMADEVVQVVDKLWTNPRAIDHDGRYFHVHGRMRGPRPQSRPLLVSAASSARGRSFAAAHCDYLFASITKPADMSEIMADIAGKATALGKPTPPVLLFATAHIREEPGAAAHEWDEMQASLHPSAQKVWAAQLSKATHGGKLTRDYPVLLGTPEEVAAQILTLQDQTGLSGLVLRMPLWAPGEAVMLGRVLQVLERAGRWRPPHERHYAW
ncbi:MAG: LLM class flavin-dependent oxidoreductase [Alphaproteobacteria bacterium]|nr:LLM class flavin-dependent oxidoreductase [Alphaproteobacteria bacterium]